MAQVNVSNIPVFTIAALVLLVLKLTAYPAITWWCVGIVWAIPLIMGLGLCIAGLALTALACIGGLLVIGCSALWGKITKKNKPKF